MSALRVEHLLKRYGGLTVTDDLSLEVRPGELHAVIGPNGAGKTTLIGQLSGELRPDGGRVLLDGVDVTRMPIERRVRRGLARSYQITSVFKPFTALENVAMAVQARRGHSFRFWRPARATPALREPARAALELAGLGRRADVPAGALAHGELRQLELAMVLACRPTLLLLDEPMAGMSQHESEAMTALLHGLRRQYSILLVEHDMQAVFALSDRVTVLVYGRVLACGSADEIRNDPQVRECYLGSERRRADRRPQESRHERAAVAARRHCALWRQPGAVRDRPGDRGWRIRLAAGPQRHGQVHHGQGHHGPEPRQPGRDPLRRARHRRAAGLPGGAVRHRPGARGPAHFPQSVGAREPGRHRAQPPAADAALDAGARLRAVPRLAERARHLGSHLSGGEQQMLAIGRALLTNPRLLILDEATEGLAPVVREEIWRALDGLKRTGLAVLCIDKNLEPLLAAADRHAIIETGRVAWSGDSQAFIDDEARLLQYLSV